MQLKLVVATPLANGRNLATPLYKFIPFLLLPIMLINLSSGMSLLGAAINYVFLLLVITSLAHGSFTVLGIVVVSNLVLGPFQLLSIGEKLFENYGRLDYLIGNLCFLYFFASGVRLGVERYLVAVVGVFFFAGFVGAINSEAGDILAFLAGGYKYMSSLLLAYVTVICLREANPRILLIWISFLLFIHLILSVIQLKVPFYLRSGTIPASLSVLGMELRRPSGLFESSYVYGVNTGLFIYFALALKSKKGTVFGGFIAALIVMSVLATRSFFLGLVMFFYIVLISRLIRIPWLILLLPIVAVVLLVPLLGFERIFTLEQSNSTKFMIWYLVLVDMWDFTWIQLFFGAGIGQSAEVAGFLGEFASEFGAAYDNNVDRFGEFPIHNIYLELLYEFGIVAFLVVFSPLVIAFARFLQNYLDGDSGIALQIFLFCVVASNYFLHNGLFSMPFCFLFVVCLLELRTRFESTRLDKKHEK